MIEIRAEQNKDFEAIRQVNLAAFKRENEANLVERLRLVHDTFSFVAIVAEQVVGHIFFSPVTIEGTDLEHLLILGLAPLAVKSEYQRQGIGSMLVRHSLKECFQSGCRAVVVLGKPTYYQRFGFSCAKEKGLKCEYDVPDEVFLVLESENGTLQNVKGTVKYHSEFRNV
jgi:putative acetyltransferase